MGRRHAAGVAKKTAKCVWLWFLLLAPLLFSRRSPSPGVGARIPAYSIPLRSSICLCKRPGTATASMRMNGSAGATATAALGYHGCRRLAIDGWLALLCLLGSAADSSRQAGRSVGRLLDRSVGRRKAEREGERENSHINMSKTRRRRCRRSGKKWKHEGKKKKKPMAAILSNRCDGGSDGNDDYVSGRYFVSHISRPPATAVPFPPGHVWPIILVAQCTRYGRAERSQLRYVDPGSWPGGGVILFPKVCDSSQSVLIYALSFLFPLAGRRRAYLAGYPGTRSETRGLQCSIHGGSARWW